MTPHQPKIRTGQNRVYENGTYQDMMNRNQGNEDSL